MRQVQKISAQSIILNIENFMLSISDQGEDLTIEITLNILGSYTGIKRQRKRCKNLKK